MALGQQLFINQTEFKEQQCTQPWLLLASHVSC
jgi:hypothetical protein